MTGRVEEAVADVADGAGREQLGLFGGGHGIAALDQQLGGRQTPDADQGHGELGPLGGHGTHGRVRQQTVTDVGAADQAGGGDEGGGGADELGQFTEQSIRVGLRGRHPETADELDDAVGPGDPQRSHPVGDREQGLAPGGDADPLTAGEGGLR